MAEEPEGTQDQEPESAPDPAPAAEPQPEVSAGAPVHAKADIGKRIIAAIIDAVIAIVIGFIPIVGGIVATAYWLVRDGLELDFMDQRSIGKKLVKLRPVTLDGSPMDIGTSIKRNWMFALSGVGQLLAFTIIGLILAIPLFFIVLIIGVVEVVLVLTDADGRRMGDKLANTMVIEVDD